MLYETVPSQRSAFSPPIVGAGALGGAALGYLTGRLRTRGERQLLEDLATKRWRLRSLREIAEKLPMFKDLPSIRAYTHAKAQLQELPRVIGTRMGKAIGAGIFLGSVGLPLLTHFGITARKSKLMHQGIVPVEAGTPTLGFYLRATRDLPYLFR